MPQSKSLLLINKDTLTKPDRRYWNVTATNVAELRRMYSVGLWDLQTNRALTTENLDPAKRGSAWFEFPTPPKSYEISEPAATVIVPTQDGGKFVESQGGIFKDIRIAGTVGLRPNPASSNSLNRIPGAGAVAASLVNVSNPTAFTNLQSATGSQNATLNSITGRDERGLSPKEATGFDDIIFLRNIFRYYFDLKQNNEWARRVVMIWWYAKENEVYIVEPLSFVTARESASPLSYNYNISFRSLFKFDSKIKRPHDTLSILSSISAGIGFVKDVLKDVARHIEEIGSAIEFLAQLPFSIVNSVISGAISVMTALANISTIGERLGDTFNQKFLQQWARNCDEMARLGSILVNGQVAGDKRVFGTAPAEGVAGVIDLPVIEDAAVLKIQRNEGIKAARGLARAANKISAQDYLFKRPKQVTVSDYTTAYYKEGQELPFTSGSQLSPSNIKLPVSSREEEILGDETIRSFAKRTTGDEANWKAISILNNQKPPYISATRGDGVMVAGDKLLIPQVANDDDLSIVDSNIDDADTQSPVLKSFGRDLMLASNSSDSGLVDLKIGPNGDLAFIEGVANVQQAMFIKFSTEEGGLPLHPDFGAAFPIGSKVSLNRTQEFSLNTRSTMLSDDRVADVYNLRIFTSGDVIFVNAKAKLKQTDASFAVEFAVRRL